MTLRLSSPKRAYSLSEEIVLSCRVENTTSVPVKLCLIPKRTCWWLEVTGQGAKPLALPEEPVLLSDHEFTDLLPSTPYQIEIGLMDGVGYFYWPLESPGAYSATLVYRATREHLAPFPHKGLSIDDKWQGIAKSNRLTFSVAQ